jgi:hypothetical protein
MITILKMQTAKGVDVSVKANKTHTGVRDELYNACEEPSWTTHTHTKPTDRALLAQYRDEMCNYIICKVHESEPTVSTKRDNFSKKLVKSFSEAYASFKKNGNEQDYLATTR